MQKGNRLNRYVGMTMLTILLVCIVLAQSARAADFYVDINTGCDVAIDPGCSAAGDGSGSAPWRTLHYAIPLLSIGDVLHVAVGTYNIANGETDDALIISNSTITIQGTGPGVIIDGTGASLWSSGFSITGSGITITGLVINYFSYAGISLSSGAGPSMINSCGIDFNNYGIYISASSPTISANTLHDNTIGIRIFGNMADASPDIVNNLISSMGTMNTGIWVQGVSSGGSAYPTLHHNTIDNGLQEGILIDQDMEPVIPDIQFNIITNFNVNGIINNGASPNIDYNNVWNNGITVADNYLNCSAGPNDISQDPTYLGMNDYYLAAGSPCIDTIPPGSDPITMDLRGTVRPETVTLANNDMGCFEILPPLAPGIYYVDIVNGMDDFMNGASPGTDAWKTLHMAMFRINAGNTGVYTLMVAPGSYNLINGEPDGLLEIKQPDLFIQGGGASSTIIDGSSSIWWENGITIFASNTTIADLSVNNFPVSGIAILSGTNVVIELCEIYANTANGIFIEDTSPIIRKNRIHNNMTGVFVSRYAAAITIEPAFINNLFYSGGGQQNGIHLYQATSDPMIPVIYHNTIDNMDSNGILVQTNTAGAEIKYNIITNTLSGNGVYAPAGTAIDYNDIWGNSVDYAGGVAAGSNDITADPLFIGSGNYRLQTGSPCIDIIPVSDNTVNEAIDSTFRPQGTQKDMGVYETLGVLNNIYVDIILGNDTTGDGSSGNPWKTLHYTIPLLSSGDILNVASGEYTTANGEVDGNITISTDNVTIQGNDPNVLIDSTGAVSWNNALEITGANVSVTCLWIRGFSNSGVYIPSGTVNTIVQGCDFENNAKGVYILNTSPSVSHNRFRENTDAIYIYATLADASPTIWNNMIAGMGTFQTGIWIESDPSGGTAYPVIHHNTIDGGSVNGIYIRQNAGTVMPDIQFNIISNFGSYGINNNSATPIIDYNDVWNNGSIPADNYLNVIPGSGDISLDPGFVGKFNHYLKGESPCIDAIPGTANTITDDIEWTSRPQPAAGSNKDMGCFEVFAPLMPGTYYVDIANGTDDPFGGTAPNTGAWQTLHFAMLRINAGNAGVYTLDVAPGTYSVATGESDDFLGIFQSNVTIQGADATNTIIDGVSASWWDGGIEVFDVSNITISNLTVQNFTSNGMVIISGSNIFIESCEVNSNGINGIHIEDSSPEILKNVIYNNLNGIYVSRTNPGVSISPTIVNNLIYPGGYQENGIYLYQSSADSMAPVIYHNTISGMNTNGILADGISTGMEIKYNSITDAITGTGISAPLGTILAYNNVWGNSINYTGGISADASDISLDPLFMGAGDYHPQGISSNIDQIPSGDNTIAEDLEGTVRPQGTAKDIGCFESAIIEDLLEVSISPAGSGTISATGITCPGDCSEVYTTDTNITLTATETAGYLFDHWEESGTPISTVNPVTFTISSDRTITITAVFVPVSTLNVSVSPAGSGTISATGITCPSDCSEIHTTGTAVTLTATETTGYQFDHWEEGGTSISTINPDTFAIDADRTIIAVFVPISTLNVSVSPAGSGTISATDITCPSDCTGTYTIGTAVTLTATETAGYQFDHWEEGGTSISTTNPDSFTINTDRTIIAVFVPVSTLNVSVSPSGSGTISATGITCPSDCTEIYATGTAVTLTATETVGYQFDHWEEGGTSISTTNPDTFTMSVDRNIVAVFIPISTLNVSVSPAGSGTISATGITCPGDCTEIYTTGTTVTLTATETVGYQFDHWEEGGTSISAINPDTFTINTDRTIIAVFIPVSTLNVSVSPAGSGTISATSITCPSDCSGTYITGTAVTLTATETTGYQFDHWEEGGTSISTINPDTFAIDADRTIVAVFVPVSTLNVSVSPAGSGTISATGIACPGDCSEIYATGTAVTLTATDTSGYQFDHWKEGGTSISSTNPDTFSMSTDRAIIAVFVPVAIFNNIDSGSEIADYQMISFPLKSDIPLCDNLFQSIEDWTYDTRYFRIGTYDPASEEYIECGSSLKVEPGRAYWILSRDGFALNLSGTSVSLNSDYNVSLYVNPETGEGWNMIACPNAAVYAWKDIEVVELDGNGTNAFVSSVGNLNEDNPYIDRQLWCWDNGNYQSNDPDTGIMMQPFEGYWVKAKKNNLVLRFRMNVQQLATEISTEATTSNSITRASNLRKSTAHADDPPPMPMGAIDSVEWNGRCFITILKN